MCDKKYRKNLQKLACVIALMVASVAADVSHLQLKDENGYHYPKPDQAFPPVSVAVENEYLPPPNEYLPP